MDNKNKKLLKQLLQLNALLHRYEHHIHKENGPLGNPNRGQGRVLALLKLKPEISQKELTFLLNMRPQSLGELLVKLERSGLITRTPSEEDKRVMIVTLTPEGEKASADADLKHSEMDTLFDDFNPEEQEQFSNYINRLIVKLEAELKDYDDMSHSFKGGHPPFGFHGRRGHHGPFGKRGCKDSDHHHHEDNENN